MKRVITESDIVKLKRSGAAVVSVNKGDIITPSAADKIRQFKMTVSEYDAKNSFTDSQSMASGGKGKVAVGSDHTGFKLKNTLSKFLTEKGLTVIDVGTYDEKSCDYPDFAFAVAVKVKEGSVDFGIIIDATGNPSAITANKLAGIRAANCYNEFTAKSAREHNNANVLTIGAKAIGEETAKSVLDAWLSTGFGGERHQRRLDKITEIEKRNMR